MTFCTFCTDSRKVNLCTEIEVNFFGVFYCIIALKDDFDICQSDILWLSKSITRQFCRFNIFSLIVTYINIFDFIIIHI